MCSDIVEFLSSSLHSKLNSVGRVCHVPVMCLACVLQGWGREEESPLRVMQGKHVLLY